MTKWQLDHALNIFESKKVLKILEVIVIVIGIGDHSVKEMDDGGLLGFWNAEAAQITNKS